MFISLRGRDLYLTYHCLMQCRPTRRASCGASLLILTLIDRYLFVLTFLAVRRSPADTKNVSFCILFLTIVFVTSVNISS